MEFDNVGLILTDRCNARCAMCCSGQEDSCSQRKTLDEKEHGRHRRSGKSKGDSRR